jgi:hypothetical protein
MSQRDVVAELRAARINAPAEVRERVRLIAAEDTTPTRRFTWRRAFVVALPVAAAIAATIVATRPTEQRTVVQGEAATVGSAAQPGVGLQQKSFSAIAPSPNRVQRVEATLSVRVPSADDVSAAMQRALRIAKSLDGFPVHVDAASRLNSATADLTLKVPRAHVRDAVTRLSALGTITAEQFDVEDLETGLNQTDRTIARVQRELSRLRAQEQTPAVQRSIEALTSRVARLQRRKAATVRSAHFATIRVHLTTPHAAAPQQVHHGPLHRLGIALKWLGIGAIYVVVLGAPVVLVGLLAWLVVRTVRRRREDALLSQP